MRPVTLNLIKEKVGNSLELISTEKSFLKGTFVITGIRAIINKINFMLLYGKGHHHLDKAAAYRMGKEFFYQLHIP